MDVCVCACVYACMCACMHACMYACMCIASGLLVGGAHEGVEEEQVHGLPFLC